jgi:hypothetical protein
MIERIIQIERGTMKITAIAARLHKIALDMEDRRQRAKVRLSGTAGQGLGVYGRLRSRCK